MDLSANGASGAWDSSDFIGDNICRPWGWRQSVYWRIAFLRRVRSVLIIFARNRIMSAARRCPVCQNGRAGVGSADHTAFNPLKKLVKRGFRKNGRSWNCGCRREVESCMPVTAIWSRRSPAEGGRTARTHEKSASAGIPGKSGALVVKLYQGLNTIERLPTPMSRCMNFKAEVHCN